MNILQQLAYTSYDYSTYDSSSSSLSSADSAAIAGFALVIYGFMFLLLIAQYVVTSLCLMRIFKKAGVTPWIAWVPFYNTWKLLELGGQQGFWAILAIIPFVNIVSAVFFYIALYHIGRKLGKDGIFLLWAIFVPLVWFIWLAVDKSTWNEQGSNAPSIAGNTPPTNTPPTPPAAPTAPVAA